MVVITESTIFDQIFKFSESMVVIYSKFIFNKIFWIN